MSALETEMDSHIGYERNDKKDENLEIVGKEYTEKIVVNDNNEKIDIQMPCDWNSTFELVMFLKHEK